MSLIYPAIDLLEGKCVRLLKGNYGQKTVYADDPTKIAQSFLDAGTTWIHVVDLEGAKAGKPVQHQLIAKIQSETGAQIQTGGGIRSKAAALELIEAGIARVVIGSMAVKDPKSTLELIREVGAERVVLALDVFVSDVPRLATEGWTKNEGKELWPLLNDYMERGLEHVLCTDISRDGTLEGPNVSLYADMRRRFPNLNVQASGGVGSLEDLKNLKFLSVSGIIVGKALYEKKFSLKEAITC
jgi:phosphoribosylformimino-5-aminoimidazole carboxamide ribotide isomerase